MLPDRYHEARKTWIRLGAGAMPGNREHGARDVILVPAIGSRAVIPELGQIDLARKSAVRAIVSMAWRMSFGRVGGADSVRVAWISMAQQRRARSWANFSTYLSAGRCGQARR